ncbi:MAG: GNAT family N-acetyltransferase [Chryseobacterium sp.]|uniref:GNAT family N-acetyltransferase n=1 Tax=Chryseobacterium sp. TaxID=1871047 RepID=UPI0025BAAABD|nr:GNAT family N-acetyltransferase [Chryseobacterium sp.]MCJ7934840.1 GNAT family N-acetyltransferase [Chryseobacterium sp.]
MNNKVSLQFLDPKDLPAISYALDESQSRFTATVEKAMSMIRERNTEDAFPVTIFNDGQPVGFFILDFGDDKFELTDTQNSVLIRSLSVNPQMQGKGIGKEAMIQVDDFVRKHFKDCHEIVLAVNQKNESAYHIYRTAGYSYEGKTRIGRSGPQYLMYKKF